MGVDVAGDARGARGTPPKIGGSETRSCVGDFGRSLVQRARRLQLPAVSSVAFTIAVSLWFTLFFNFSFWAAVERTQATSAHRFVFMLSLLVFVTILINLLLTFVMLPLAGKPIVILLFITSAAVTHFIDRFGLAIDNAMLHNILETDTREALQLASWGLILHVALYGALPALLVARLPVRYRSFSRELLLKVLVVVASLVGLAMIVLPLSRHYAAFFRNHRDLQHMLTPINYLGAIDGYVKERFHHQSALQSIGKDASRGAASGGQNQKLLLILVVGETARAASFSLGSYPRPTNPELSARKDVSFTEVISCGTSTATSLPCMFSGLGRSDFSAATNQEGLLDVIRHSGFDVLWRDNNSGCKGVCSRVETESVADRDVPGLCRNGECWDEILLEGLQARLDRTRNDTVIVLHQKGSHGPAYYRRYPDRFEVFRPACRHDDLAQCSAAEITNAYDNSIVYTDHLLAETIRLLEQNSTRFDTAMIYVSDHGESLGEKGLYLHGMPYVLAPVEQKSVPLIVWLSPEYRRRFNLDVMHLGTEDGRQYSHDNLFHSVLGLLRIKTYVYRAELDLFATRRSK